MNRDEALLEAISRWGAAADVDENHAAGVSLYVVGVHMARINTFVALGSGPSYRAAFDSCDEAMWKAIR